MHSLALVRNNAESKSKVLILQVLSHWVNLDGGRDYYSIAFVRLFLCHFFFSLKTSLTPVLSQGLTDYLPIPHVCLGG